MTTVGTAPFEMRTFGCLSPLCYDDTTRCFLSGIQKATEVGRYWFGWLRDWMPEILFAVPKWAGRQVRDGMYLPLNSSPTPVDLATMGLASRIRKMLVGEELITDEAKTLLSKLEEVAEAFDIQKRAIRITSENKTYIFNTYVVKSVDRPDGKKICFNLVSFYGNEVEVEGDNTPYKPETIDELAAALVLVRKAFSEIHSVSFYSLGAVMSESLKYLHEDEKASLLRDTILDRAFSSTRKVAPAIEPLWKRYGAYLGAYMGGWFADPEKAFADFYQSFNSLEGRTLSKVDVEFDNYFAGERGYNPSFLPSLAARGMTVYEGIFIPPGVPALAEHSTDLSHLLNFDGGRLPSQYPLPMYDLEAVPDALMRECYNFPQGECHESLFFGGNRETLDIMILRLYPMFRAFMNS